MSEHAITLFGGKNLPAYIKNLGIDETTRNLLSGGGGKRISIRGGVFRKMVNGEEVMKSDDRAMNVVVVRSAPTVNRNFYAGTYVEGENQAPTCWSADGEKPDASIEAPQHSNCRDCPKNIKGSGQGDSRACRFSRRLAVVLDGDLEGDVMQLVLPAQSVFGKGENGLMPLEQYVRFLTGHGVPLTAVVTEMKFDTDSSTPKLTFKPVRPLSEEEYEVVCEQGNTQDAIDAVTFTVSQTASAAGTEEDSSVVAKAAKSNVAGKAKAKAKVEAALDAAGADDDEDDAPPAPAPKPKTKKPAPEPEVSDDEDDEDDEEAELLRKLAEAKAKKAAAKAAEAKKDAAPADDDEEQQPRVRSKKAAAPAKVTSAADVISAWDDDDDDTDD